MEVHLIPQNLQFSVFIGDESSSGLLEIKLALHFLIRDSVSEETDTNKAGQPGNAGFPPLVPLLRLSKPFPSAPTERHLSDQLHLLFLPLLTRTFHPPFIKHSLSSSAEEI